MAVMKPQEGPSQFAVDLLRELMGKSDKVTAKSVVKSMSIATPFEPEDDSSPPTLAKSILNVLNAGKTNSIERLAFETDPSLTNQYAGLYKQKLKLLPDTILKRIAIQDDLVASIVNMRANHISRFGRPRPDRHSIGFVVEPNDPDLFKKLKPEEAKALKDAIAAAESKLLTCGSTVGWHDKDRITFPQYLFQSTKNAIVLGRIATEIIWVENAQTGKEEFHSFRPIDAGTIYKAAPQHSNQQAVRDEALNMLEQMKNKKLEPERFKKNEYAWVQVINGQPVQAFTSKECVVHNFYPVNDVEMDGYPVTPLDTVIAAVTCHINITTWNKVYFQSGRAARGMLVIQSDDADQDTSQKVKVQFSSNINGTSNAWKMPVFVVGKDDKVEWQPIDNGSRDMEFQYLSDTNARVIMSAFQVSPEELPGYQHLARGTNSQALSEGNNEYLLEAHRDVGIRPLLLQWQDHINAVILPLIDPKLAVICSLRLVGLDAETEEKESIRLQQDMGIHYTMDEILHKVEKEPLGKEWGGTIPLNAVFKSTVLDPYFTVGQILEHFCGVAGASQDPTLAYRRDQFWFDQQQAIMAQQQAQMQAQQAAAGGGQPPGGGGGSSGPPSGGDGDSSGQQASADAQSAQQDNSAAADQATQEVSANVDQAAQALGKSERQLTVEQRHIMARADAMVVAFMRSFDESFRAAGEEVARVVAAEHAGH